MGKKLCMIVDDSSVVRKISRKIMEDLGFDVVEAENGERALKLGEEKLPQLIMLDWNMPVMSGIEFINKFSQTQKKHNIKIIFCTTENDLVKIMTAMEAGASEYIMKPFDEEIIKSKLTQMGLI